MKVPVNGAAELDNAVELEELKVVLMKPAALLPPSDNTRFRIFPLGACRLNNASLAYAPTDVALNVTDTDVIAAPAGIPLILMGEVPGVVLENDSAVVLEPVAKPGISPPTP